MHIGIDIGGTFTHFVLLDEMTGTFETFKILAMPRAPEEAVLTGLSQQRQAGKIDRPEIVHGSTVATNALLEGKGTVTALIATHPPQAVHYVFRALVALDILSNSGCLAPIEVIAPASTMANAISPAAVAAGNVETSQRITDVLLGALAHARPEGKFSVTRTTTLKLVRSAASQGL